MTLSKRCSQTGCMHWLRCFMILHPKHYSCAQHTVWFDKPNLFSSVVPADVQPHICAAAEPMSLGCPQSAAGQSIESPLLLQACISGPSEQASPLATAPSGVGTSAALQHLVGCQSANALAGTEEVAKIQEATLADEEAATGNVSS